MKAQSGTHEFRCIALICIELARTHIPVKWNYVCLVHTTGKQRYAQESSLCYTRCTNNHNRTSE
jgi:hypothetical protein